MPREQTSAAALRLDRLHDAAPDHDAGPDKGRFDVAAQRLSLALTHLEIELADLQQRLGQQAATHRESDALRRDRAQLATDLDNARARERELAALADEAALVVSGAIQDVKAAMRGLNG